MYLTSPLSEVVSLCDLVSGKPRCLVPSLPRTDLLSHWLEWFEKKGLFCSPKTKSTECGMPLILFKYEKSPMICKQMYNIYKSWMLSLSLNGPSDGRPASVSTNHLRTCLSCSVSWFLPALWVPVAVLQCAGCSVRHMVLVFGESVSWGFFLFDLVFMC